MSGFCKSYNKTFTTVPTTIKPDFSFNAYQVIIKPDQGIIGVGQLFIGDADNCEFPIPAEGISLSDMHRYDGEESWELEKIMVRSTADGLAANIILMGLTS